MVFNLGVRHGHVIYIIILYIIINRIAKNPFNFAYNIFQSTINMCTFLTNVRLSLLREVTPLSGAKKSVAEKTRLRIAGLE